MATWLGLGRWHPMWTHEVSVVPENYSAASNPDLV